MPVEEPIDRLLRLARRAALPEVEVSTSYGAPCLRARGKVIASVKDASNAVHYCPLDQKAFLLEVALEIYWQTDHFKGWPGILVRLDVITDEELTQRLIEAWRNKVPKRLATLYGSSKGA
jgi:hypothetical protein